MSVTTIVRNVIQIHDTKPKPKFIRSHAEIKCVRSIRLTYWFPLEHLLPWVFNIECPITRRSVSTGSQTSVLVILRY